MYPIIWTLYPSEKRATPWTRTFTTDPLGLRGLGVSISDPVEETAVSSTSTCFESCSDIISSHLYFTMLQLLYSTKNPLMRLSLSSYISLPLSTPPASPPNRRPNSRVGSIKPAFPDLHSSLTIRFRSRNFKPFSEPCEISYTCDKPLYQWLSLWCEEFAPIKSGPSRRSVPPTWLSLKSKYDNNIKTLHRRKNILEIDVKKGGMNGRSPRNDSQKDRNIHFHFLQAWCRILYSAHANLEHDDWAQNFLTICYRCSMHSLKHYLEDYCRLFRTLGELLYITDSQYWH